MKVLAIGTTTAPKARVDYIDRDKKKVYGWIVLTPFNVSLLDNDCFNIGSAKYAITELDVPAEHNSLDEPFSATNIPQYGFVDNPG